MRTYEILDADGTPLYAQVVDDSIAPVLIAGQTARLLELDGERLAKGSRVAVGPDAPPAPDPEDLETEAEAAEKRAAAKAARDAAKAEAAQAEAAGAETGATEDVKA